MDSERQTQSNGRSPQKGEGKIMKKAILIICVLSVLALLVVSVAADAVSAGKGLDSQTGSGPVKPGALKRGVEELDQQVPPDIYPFAKT